MESVRPHEVPAGPLAVRWLAYDLPELRAGMTARATVVFENAGSAEWRSRGESGVQLSYHWLDDRGNPIAWDGPRRAFAEPVPPGSRAEAEVELRVPRPPGAYRLAFDLVEEFRFWFAEIGSPPLELPVGVRPRIDERLLGVVVHPGPGDERATQEALAAQEEPLVADGAVAVAHIVQGTVPETDWSRRLLDAHAEGYAAVGGSIEPDGSWLARRRGRRLEPWAPGGGRNPAFAHPLLLPSLLAGLEPQEHDGLPAYPSGEDTLFDARIRLRLRSGRPRA